MTRINTVFGVVGLLVFSTSAIAANFQNGDFETFTSGVADGWTTYIWGNLPGAWSYNANLPERHGGMYCQQMARGTALRDDRGIGLYQTIDANLGDAFVFEGYAKCNKGSTGISGVLMKMRLDWSGGTNHDTAGVVHSFAQSANTWTYSNRKAFESTSSSGSVTLFIEAVANTGKVSDAIMYWDDFQVHRTHVPLALTLGGQTDTTIDLDVNLGDNIATNEYAISITGGAFGSTEGVYWVQTDGTVGTSKADADAFGTESFWDSLGTVTGLDPMTEYTLQALARYDNDYRQETAFGSTASAMTTPEPMALALLSFGMSLFVGQRRKH